VDQGFGARITVSRQLRIAKRLARLQVSPDRVEHHPRSRGHGAGGGGCAGQLSLNRNLGRSSERFGHTAIGQHDPRHLPAPQLPFIVLSACSDYSTEVRTRQRGPGLHEIEEEHVLGLGQQAATGELGADRGQLLPAVRQIVLMRLAHADQLSRPPQHHAHRRSPQPAAAAHSADHSGHCRLGGARTPGELRIRGQVRLLQPQVVGQRTQHMGRVVGPLRHAQVDFGDSPVAVPG
jgi:hypothetical protein